MFPLLVLLACTATDGPWKDEVGDTAPPRVDSVPTDTDPDTERDTADTADSGGAPGPVLPVPCDTWAEPRDVGYLADPEREEVSGVAPSLVNPGVLWMLEDHGNAPAFYAIDLTGAALGTLTLEGIENDDWEAIALGPCPTGSCLWAADVGDNSAVRTEVQLYRVPEPAVGWGGGLDATVVAERFPLVYADGPVNVEAMFLTPEGLPVFLSKRGDGTSRVYVVDTLVADEVAAPRYVGELATFADGSETGGLVTSADLWPDGSRLLVRTYDGAWELDLGDGGIEGIPTAPRIALPFADERQVESVAYDTVLGGYWQIPEGVNVPISFVACLD
ncbi:MAG: hypothetical protein Q8P41_11560 [Pseudomonadota bacterium]|nr:hypothetical protein [Pseudomonadota bacterium]